MVEGLSTLLGAWTSSATVFQGRIQHGETMSWIDHSGNCMKDTFPEGNSGAAETKLVAVVIGNRGLIQE